MRLTWHRDDTVSGILSFDAAQLGSAPSVLVLSGHNARSGQLELTTAENGASVALIQLNKWIRDGKIFWGGICRFSDGLSQNIEISRVIQAADLQVTASTYVGKLGLSEANLEILWRDDKTVSGRLLVVPPRSGVGDYDVVGNNLHEGKLTLTLSALGQVLGSLDLTKKIVFQKVHWQGVVTFSNGESDSILLIKSPPPPASRATPNLEPQG